MDNASKSCFRKTRPAPAYYRPYSLRFKITKVCMNLYGFCQIEAHLYPDGSLIQLDQARVDRQLHNSDLVALWVSFASLMFCIPCFRLQDRQSIWRKFPYRILVWYVGVCMFHTICGLLLDTLFPPCSRFSAVLSSYCEIQRYVLVALMLHWLHRFEAGVRADRTIWIALIAPLLICFWTPKPLTRRNCILDGGEANRFYVLVGSVSFMILASLTLAGLCRGRPEPPTPSTPSNTQETSFQLTSANNLVEFEPDSPTCYQHLGTNTRSPRLPIGQRSGSNVQLTPPQRRQTLELEELAHASVELAIAVNGSLEDRFLESELQHTTLANLKFAILVLASKCTIVLGISTVIRSILYFQPFHTETESALVFGLMVELLLENTEGFFVTLLVLSLFETQWSRLIRYVRNRHRQARSRSPSLQSTVQNT